MQARYEAEAVSFLVEGGDSVAAYEREGLARAPDPNAAFASAFDAAVPDRSVQRNILLGFNDMKEELHAFLGALPAGTVVRKEDIDDFFAGLNAKRPRLH